MREDMINLMNKIQKLAFRNVGDFLDYLPEDELAVVECLRELVLEALPEVKEKLSYNVPFYYRHRRICYIWPASVPWGKVSAGVTLGFCQGHLLVDDDYLCRSDRKNVATVNFRSVSQVDIQKIQDLLWQAAAIDDTL